MYSTSWEIDFSLLDCLSGVSLPMEAFYKNFFHFKISKITSLVLVRRKEG